MSTAETWETIDRLARISHSFASNTQRLMKQAFESREALLGKEADLAGSIETQFARSPRQGDIFRESLAQAEARAESAGGRVMDRKG